MFGMNALDVIVIFLYFILLIWIGIRVSKRIKNEDDFLLGGQKLGRLLQTFMNFGMATSAQTSVGAARETFRQGMAGIWIQLFYLFATPFYWFTTVWIRRLRIKSMGEFYRIRYESKAMEILFSFLGILLLTSIISTGMVALEKTVAAIATKDKSVLTIEEKQYISDFKEMVVLENAIKSRKLNADEIQNYERLKTLKSQGKVQSAIPAINSTVFLLVISVLLLFYTILGGVMAAAITDVFQGVLLIVLSILLLPFGLSKIGGFSGLHDKVPEFYFNLFGSSTMSDYTWYYIVVLVLMGMLMTEAQPQNVQIMGSAKNEEDSRVGRIYGNFMKRIVVILWGVTGLIGYALYRNEVSNPDMLWGHMSRELLTAGFIGLMIVCLLAALQSTASALLISIGALFTKGIYQYIIPGKSDKHYFNVSRITIAVVLVLSVWMTLYFDDFLRLTLFSLSVGLVFGPVFWISFFWRRANAKGALAAIVYTFLFTVLIGYFGEKIVPISKSDYFTQMTQPKQIIRKTGAIQNDVDAGRAKFIGQTIEKEIVIPPKGVFFEEVNRENANDSNSRLFGSKHFRASLLFPAMLGIDLTKMSKAQLASLGYLLDILLPFLIIILISLLTKANSEKALNDFYGRLHTPAAGTLEEQKKAMELTRKNPKRFEHRKLFPNTNIELPAFSRRDIVGFLLICAAVGVVVLLMIGIVSIGITK